MNLHTLKNNVGARTRSKRLGRGEGSGTGKTAGRGTKGYGSRSGSGHRPQFEGGQMPLIRRLPKRGFHSPTRVAYIPVNVGDLVVFAEGATVDVAALRECGLVKGPPAPIKLLGTGELAKKLIVKADAYSAAAKAKIEAAGGQCDVIGA